MSRFFTALEMPTLSGRHSEQQAGPPLSNCTPCDDFLSGLHRGCSVLTLQMTPNQKPQRSFFLAHEICSGFKPLPGGSLIQHSVWAASVCLQASSLTGENRPGLLEYDQSTQEDLSSLFCLDAMLHQVFALCSCCRWNHPISLYAVVCTKVYRSG